MTSKSSKKALARNGDDSLCGFATAALKQVAADRLSGTNSRANIDVLPYFRSLVGARDYDGPDQTMVALAEVGWGPGPAAPRAAAVQVRVRSAWVEAKSARAMVGAEEAKAEEAQTGEAWVGATAGPALDT